MLDMAAHLKIGPEATTRYHTTVGAMDRQLVQQEKKRRREGTGCSSHGPDS